MLLDLFIWWCEIGFAACLAAGTYITEERTFKTIFIIVCVSLLLSLGGLITAGMIVYWFWDGWRSQFAVDEDGRRIYPWRE